jgi:hypothetical protein
MTDGTTSTLCTPELTVIVTLACFVASAADVAVMLTDPGLTAVTRPLVLTVATDCALVAHVTVWLADS